MLRWKATLGAMSSWNLIVLAGVGPVHAERGLIGFLLYRLRSVPHMAILAELPDPFMCFLRRPGALHPDRFPELIHTPRMRELELRRRRKAPRAGQMEASKPGFPK